VTIAFSKTHRRSHFKGRPEDEIVPPLQDCRKAIQARRSEFSWRNVLGATKLESALDYKGYSESGAIVSYQCKSCGSPGSGNSSKYRGKGHCLVCVATLSAVEAEVAWRSRIARLDDVVTAGNDL
jgi:hypothetical protein